MDINQNTYQTKFNISIEGIDISTIDQVTIVDINLTESLLTPGLQTSIIVQSTTNNSVFKNLDDYYGKSLSLSAERPIIEAIYGNQVTSKIETKQIIYRLSKREKTNYQIEQFQIDTCDPSLLVDASKYISRSWKGATPTQVTEEVLRQDIGRVNVDLEESFPNTDYIAGMLHPFQIITQQAERALKSRNDPSYVHFMTYQDDLHRSIPTHNFRSLTAMAKQKSCFAFVYGAKAGLDLNYAVPEDIMTYMFPCDFDLLSDILNGYDPTSGRPSDKINIINTLTNKFASFGGDPNNLSPVTLASNMLTEGIQNSNVTNTEISAQLRKARMALLDQDKLALRLTVPFNPHMNAGRTIDVTFYNTSNGDKTYGTGKYLISAMTHNIKSGGFATTTMDCVSNTVAAGRQ